MPERNNVRRFMSCQLAPFLWAHSETEHHGSKGAWWSRGPNLTVAREQGRDKWNEWHGTRHSPQGQVSNDLLPSTRLHSQKFPSPPNNASKLWIHQWINPLMKLKALMIWSLPKIPTCEHWFIVNQAYNTEPSHLTQRKPKIHTSTYQFLHDLALLLFCPYKLLLLVILPLRWEQVWKREQDALIYLYKWVGPGICKYGTPRESWAGSIHLELLA
jgi:hypothetical protein